MIAGAGFQTFDPSKYKSYHYANFPNVVTSLEFERILSRLRALPAAIWCGLRTTRSRKKIAWLQCVGSRDVKYHSYCSSVCCMYAIKEAVIAKEHCKAYDLDAAIFFMDMRTFGKEFEQYYNRAQEERGAIHPLPDPHHRPGPRRQSDDQLHR